MAFVQVNDIQAVPQLRSAGECKNLVCCGVPEVEAPPKLRVRFDREKAKRAVENPLDLRLPASSLNDCAPECFPFRFEFHVETRCPESGSIR
jgi:hypothetical protein